jgi:hypothetical protein
MLGLATAFLLVSGEHMMGVVPELYRGLQEAVLITQGAQAGGVQHERSGIEGFHPDPTYSKHTEKVTTRKEKDIACCGAHAFHYAISPVCNLLWRFSTGAAVAK